MMFLCNKCLVMLTGAPSEVYFFTSCLHILCHKCWQGIQNNICPVCNKLCQIIELTKDMPAAVKSYFEPPMAKITRLQNQFRFLKYQQHLAFTMKKQIIKNKKEAAVRTQRLAEFEKAAIAEKIRMEAIAKAKVEEYKQLKEQYNKMIAEEQAIRQRIASKLRQRKKDLSADSGLYSSDRSRSVNG